MTIYLEYPIEPKGVTFRTTIAAFGFLKLTRSLNLEKHTHGHLKEKINLQVTLVRGGKLKEFFRGQPQVLELFASMFHFRPRRMGS